MASFYAARAVSTDRKAQNRLFLKDREHRLRRLTPEHEQLHVLGVPQHLNGARQYLELVADYCERFRAVTVQQRCGHGPGVSVHHGRLEARPYWEVNGASATDSAHALSSGL
jgi:hypothetical protein